ncbi:Hcp family type VI secretion system effector [Pectobacterium brasiliense]|uniref:Hcp family type VI secretion system effector n=1 Tax=Pectobacterium brasiliense TaxID=180957 RepID=UPI0009077D32|nr:Hcp family type VI secretion system effector [Pectobacterium brasiliense]MBN3097943.1 Hcp family type VI secretion system effector [Pectobacterium brasiliense]MBN3103187.1 Hcp family type VI secretion system effector [Pectobacterium brasiliense]MBN3131871.1 Hcp family type VI secretion system effector [Pectobacterium brasiliense]MBN3164002.1 Hcp family type VI secretion system effector [Pectobacterium brasiliense]MBN3181385.1 Hcp family type VI secretion system effector [Pectobacterium bras
MSSVIYLELTGDKQGLISSGCSSLQSIGNRSQLGHEDQIQVLSLNHSMSYDDNLSCHPVELIKFIDKSSPLLGVSVSSNERLTANFFLYRVNSAGQLELFYEIKLTDVRIVDISCNYPHSINNNEMMPYEKVLLKYNSISWEHKVAGTSGYSIWNDSVL